MFGRFFGKRAEKPQEASRVDPVQIQEIDNFYDQLKVLEKRYQDLLIKRKECRDEAVDEAAKANKAGDRLTALKRGMKRMRLIQKDLAEIVGQLFLLSGQRKDMLEGSFSGVKQEMKSDKREIKKILNQADRDELLDELEALAEAAESDKEAIKNTQKKVKIDDIADVKADLEDTVADNSRMQARIVNEGEEIESKDALLEELEELEAEAAESDKEAINNTQKEDIPYFIAQFKALLDDLNSEDSKMKKIWAGQQKEANFGEIEDVKAYLEEMMAAQLSDKQKEVEAVYNIWGKVEYYEELVDELEDMKEANIDDIDDVKDFLEEMMDKYSDMDKWAVFFAKEGKKELLDEHKELEEDEFEIELRKLKMS